jgi:hypothetical protein
VKSRFLFFHDLTRACCLRALPELTFPPLNFNGLMTSSHHRLHSQFISSLTRTLFGLDQKSRRKKEVRTKRISLQNATMYNTPLESPMNLPLASSSITTHHHPSSSIILLRSTFLDTTLLQC